MGPSPAPLETNEPPSRPPAPELSEREVEVLRLVATGVGNKEIAQQLFISPNTVRVHLRNIFAKIGVTSRTEAAMYALREGVVTLPPTPETNAPPPVAEPLPLTEDKPAASAPAPAAAPTAPTPPRRRWLLWGGVAALVVLLLGAAGLGLAVPRPTPTAPPTPVISPTPPRWQTLADMPTARSELAAAVYNDQIYAIAGESAQGTTGTTERYDPAANTWEVLAPKRVPVSKVGAAVIGGQIYVPGGLLASGQVTTALEAYSPRDNRWQPLAPLPVAVGAYALAAFEGQLYVFGGWDGEKYSAAVYRYDPDTDQWAELTPMPTARGYAGATVAGGRIYVIGGVGSAGAATVNEVYSPEQEGQAGNSPWQARAPLPRACARLQAADIADSIYVAGSGDESRLCTLGYQPSANAWQTFQAPPEAAWDGTALVALDNSLHLLGGREATTPIARHLAYQALFTVFIPIVR